MTAAPNVIPTTANLRGSFDVSIASPAQGLTRISPLTHRPTQYRLQSLHSSHLQESPCIKALGCSLEGIAILLDSNGLTLHPRRILGKTPQNRRARIGIVQQRTILAVERF